MKLGDILAALMAFYRFRCEDEGIEYVVLKFTGRVT